MPDRRPDAEVEFNDEIERLGKENAQLREACESEVSDFAESASAARAEVERLATENQRLTERVNELRPLAAHGVRTPQEYIDALTAERDQARAAIERVRAALDEMHDGECAARSWTPCDCAVATIRQALDPADQEQAGDEPDLLVRGGEG